MGVPHKRIRDGRYDELLDNFMRAVVRRYFSYFDRILSRFLS